MPLLGERIAALRKAHNVTQVQLAEALGVSQQTFQAYEVRRRRIPVSALPVVARLLEVSLDELFGIGKTAMRGKRGPASQLERSIERIGELPKQKQRFVMERGHGVSADIRTPGHGAWGADIRTRPQPLALGMGPCPDVGTPCPQSSP